MLVSVIHIRMGAAQRNPSILFEAVAYVSLGRLRVSAPPREKLSFRSRIGTFASFTGKGKNRALFAS